MIVYKQYKDYDSYLAHQAEKLDLQMERKRSESKGRLKRFRKQFKSFANFIGKGRVLCLGARLGEEVHAFIDLGFDAIGIDINPGPKNKYVIKGDFHKIPFDDGSIETVYCNCLDHSSHIPKVSSEIARVLTGKFLLEIHNFALVEAKEYEAATWITTADLFKQLKEFRVLKRVPSAGAARLDAFVMEKKWLY